MTQVTVLITGANRGIGKGILGLYLQKPNHTVIAANRDPDHPTSKSLFDLPKAEGTSLHVIKIDQSSPTDPAKGVEQLSAKGVDKIDILVANAGIGLAFLNLADVEPQNIQQHMEVNVYGFLRLYKAFKPLLEKGKDSKWVTIGSSAAYLTVNFFSTQNCAYAPTKLLQHYYTRVIAAEEPWLIAFPIEPGFVRTDLGHFAASQFGGDVTPPLSTEESSTGIVQTIDTSTLETHSGRLWKYDGTQEPW